jgi:hypothetical protein
MFRALLAQLQEVLHKQQLLYSVRVICVEVELQFHSNLGSSQQTQHARNIPIVVCSAPPVDEQVVLETC